MTLDPFSLATEPDTVESIERATLRMVAQAIYEFRQEAATIFREETDLPQDVAEDVTREALESMGTSRVPVRLFGKIDYKRARYVFHPEYAIRQALFVDSKAEAVSGWRTATIQTGQTSLRIRQTRSGVKYDEQGGLPLVIVRAGHNYLTTTVFVKYNYYMQQVGEKETALLKSISIAGLPNGLLQQHYNPSPEDSIWLAGRNAPSRGEPFRVRISLPRLKAKANWRVQHIRLGADEDFTWDD